MTAFDITLDREAHRVTRTGRDVKLGPAESGLLETRWRMQAASCGAQLIDRVWGNSAEIDERIVDVHIGRLRKALVRGAEPDPI